MVGREGDRELENHGEQWENWRRKEELTILGDGGQGGGSYVPWRLMGNG